ncbi:epithelial-stromal interaction protein 1 isoform X1 [Cheilinus undulatus]|uniref:epithelial-stromal interaction protein 1 isoform X1 n=1 Tax=Cheilinus undulatus TaxID=241271 RepID=UPI001BD3BCE0|nr:epithelial-stromal interaction protein 1 isoform X1 [Cheilinus undulatus]
MMDPSYNQRDLRRSQLKNNNRYIQERNSGAPEYDEDGTPVNGNTAERGQEQQTARQPQHTDGFTMIPPNESRRSKLNMMAQKEEESFQRWKEANRPASVHINPEKLGGDMSFAEAREKQMAGLRGSKLQKKMKKEELDRRRRQEEEEALQRMKAVQREKAERLEQRSRQEEQKRRELHKQDHLRTTESFLQRLERTAPGPLASSSATHTSSRRDATENSQMQMASRSVTDMKQEQKRVNSAFLDRLEGRGRGSEESGGVKWEERPYYTSEDPINVKQEPPLAHLDPSKEQSCSSWTQEADSDQDYDWALMKLMNRFPDCCKEFLEDILCQCSGDYEEAQVLLISTLS